MSHRAAPVLAAAVIRPSSTVRAAPWDRGDQALGARDPGGGQRSEDRPAGDPPPLLERTDEQCGQHKGAHHALYCGEKLGGLVWGGDLLHKRAECSGSGPFWKPSRTALSLFLLG